MTAARKIAYGFCGFTLSLVVAFTAAAGLRLLFTVLWVTPPSLVVAYGSSLAIVTTAIASTWVGLLQSLKNEAMIRGVWFHVYTVIAIAVVSLILSLVT
jgi:hypothetical protein